MGLPALKGFSVAAAQTDCFAFLRHPYGGTLGLWVQPS